MPQRRLRGLFGASATGFTPHKRQNLAAVNPKRRTKSKTSQENRLKTTVPRFPTGGATSAVAPRPRPYAVRYTIARMSAKPTRSTGVKVVPRTSTVEMVAAIGSEVPRSAARMDPASCTPCRNSA